VKRSPLLSGVLSLIVPGLGQIYAGESTRGAAVIVGAVVVANLNILILPLISMANPDLSASRSVWAYWIPRVVHDVSSLWSIAYWVWAVVDAVVIVLKQRNVPLRKRGV
jgi:TM2 domain-containing membrane protein YozV